MKRIFATLMAACLLFCGCQTAEPTSTESTPESIQSSTQATTEAPAESTTEATPEATTEATTEPTTTQATEPTIEAPTTPATEPTIEAPTTPATEPEETQPDKVTVYLLEKAVFCDNGYSEFFYDDAYNINIRKDYDIENKYLGRVNFIEKDQNGMACMIWEETRTEDVHSLTYYEDGKLKEEMLNVNESNYTGWQYEYDPKGDVIEKREYYEGILQSTVIYEYNGEELWRVYCEDPRGNHLYDCRVEGGRIIEKVIYSTDSIAGCSYRYEYDDNGNLIMEYFLFDGELLPGTSYFYRAVEVDYERAEFLEKQQAYLVSIT